MTKSYIRRSKNKDQFDSNRLSQCVVLYMNASCHIWMRHVTYECVMSHMNASCHIWMRHVTYECVMSHMNASCHTLKSVITYECVMSHRHESMSHRNESYIRRTNRQGPSWLEVPQPIRHVTYECVISHMNESYIRMGWLRLVGALKLQVSSAEYRLFYRALLQKRPVI